MPPRRRDCVEDVHDRENPRHLEQRLEQMDQRIDPEGDGEPEFDEDDEGDNNGYDENWKFDEFKGNDMGVFASTKYDEDDKEVDVV
ncbi:hypothetical protein CRG98_010608 [Punica granatum]|uniref:PRP1 splicing factor N-terminal domain-containing protein n=1 Tax=Punica granatum TaxID=22663 RepID=A0A2I0KME6_PUNGR|nr:hypothetical protein CRG98_010608 [Punica granatum]